MLKKKKKQSISMEDHGYRDGKGKKKEEDFFDKIDYEVSSILLKLSHPVVFSSHSPLFHKWGHTKRRSSSSSLHLHPPKPVFKSLPYTEVGDLVSNSSSSCLTGDAKKTNPQTIKKVLEEEFSTKNLSSSQPNTTCSVLEIPAAAEMGLLRAQVGLVAQPIRVDQNLRHLQPLISVDRTVNVRDVEMRMDNLELRGFDLNLPASEELGNRIAAMVGFQRVATKVQAAAQARQRRLGLIRSKKLYNRFISSYQLK